MIPIIYFKIPLHRPSDIIHVPVSFSLNLRLTNDLNEDSKLYSGPLATLCGGCHQYFSIINTFANFHSEWQILNFSIKAVVFISRSHIAFSWLCLLIWYSSSVFSHSGLLKLFLFSLNWNPNIFQGILDLQMRDAQSIIVFHSFLLPYIDMRYFIHPFISW
jgi:hypothetical protein